MVSYKEDSSEHDAEGLEVVEAREGEGEGEGEGGPGEDTRDKIEKVLKRGTGRVAGGERGPSPPWPLPSVAPPLRGPSPSTLLIPPRSSTIPW